jgi:hypothetical protein
MHVQYCDVCCTNSCFRSTVFTAAVGLTLRVWCAPLLPLLVAAAGCWRARKAVAERELRVFVRHVDFDNMQLQEGVRVFVAEAYEPDTAPPAYVDPVLQGGALNAKPPKPPR